MSKHENKINKVTCRCTEGTCELSYAIYPDTEFITFIPTINNKAIIEFTDKEGQEQTIPKIHTKQGAINQAYQIAKLCPNFNKTR